MGIRHAEPRREKRVTFWRLPGRYLSVVVWRSRKTFEFLKNGPGSSSPNAAESAHVLKTNRGDRRPKELFLGQLRFIDLHIDVDTPAATAPSKQIVPRPVFISSQSTHGESRPYPNPPMQPSANPGFVTGNLSETDFWHAVGRQSYTDGSRTGIRRWSPRGFKPTALPPSSACAPCSRARDTSDRLVRS